MFSVGYKILIFIFGTVEVAYLSSVAFIIKYGQVSNNLIDTFFGKCINLPGLHLKNSSLLLGGVDLPMLWKHMDNPLAFNLLY